MVVIPPNTNLTTGKDLINAKFDEVDTSLAGLDPDHNHDDLYYTESEVDTLVAALATVADLNAHLADGTDAHDASAISVVDAGAHFTSDTVEGALQELGARPVGSGGATQINDLTDVDTSTDAPVTGDVLGWDGTQWEPVSTPASAGVGSIDGVSPASPGGDVNLVAGEHMSITPDDGADAITFAATGFVESIGGVSPGVGGDVGLVAGENINITPGANQLTIAAVAQGSGASVPGDVQNYGAAGLGGYLDGAVVSGSPYFTVSIPRDRIEMDSFEIGDKVLLWTWDSSSELETAVLAKSTTTITLEDNSPFTDSDSAVLNHNWYGSISSGSNVLTLPAADTCSVGQWLLIPGAGASGGDYSGRIRSIAGDQVTLEDSSGANLNASTTVADAWVGRDDGPPIQAALNAENLVYLSPVAGGYGVRLAGPLRIPNNRTLLGSHKAGRLERIGQFLQGAKFIKSSAEPGASNIIIQNVWIEGHKEHLDEMESHQSNCQAILMESLSSTTVATNMAYINNTIREWPGSCLQLHNVYMFRVLGNQLIGAHRDNITCRFRCSNGVISGNQITNGYDDGIAVTATEPGIALTQEGVPQYISITGNSIVRAATWNDDDGDYGGGTPIPIRGGRDISIVGNNCVRSTPNTANILIESRIGPGPRYDSTRISIIGNTCALSDSDGIQTTSTCSRIIILGNNIYNAAGPGITNAASNTTVGYNLIS